MELFKNLIGKEVNKIYMNEQYLKFETNDGNVVFGVYGDCCSESCFYDFLGVKKLLKNKLVKSVEVIELHPNLDEDKKMKQEEVEVYGYRIITEDEELGEVSSVFSFRNYSNGYYGGSIYETNDCKVSPEITDDVLETVEG